MYELEPLIKDLALILSVAGVITILFQKLRQPIVLGYLVAGVIIGPYTPPHILVNDIPNIQILSELGIIFLMFSLGLKFSFQKLKRVGFSASVTGLLEVIIMLALGITIGKLMGWSFYNSLFLGAALSISSTTIIIKALEELHLKSKQFAEIVFGILIVEDLLAILMMVVLSTIVVNNNIFSSIFWASAKLILVTGSWFLLGYFLLPSFFRKMKQHINEETLIVISTALCLLLVWIAHYFHYSSALGAFIMGSILAETPLVHQIQKLIQPVKNIFAAVFFVSVGMLIDPKMIWQDFHYVIAISAVTIVGKLLSTSLSAFLSGQKMNDSLRIGFSMAQIGEFSFIIAGLGVALKITSHALYPIIVAVSAITTFATPYLIRFSGYLSHKIDQKLPDKTKDWIESYTYYIDRIVTQSNKRSTYSIGTRIIVNGIIIAIIFKSIQFWGIPKLVALLEITWPSKILAWLIAIFISSPFVWGILTAFRVKTQPSVPIYHRIILDAGWLIATIEIIILSFGFLDTWLIASFSCVIAILFFVILYKQLGKSYHWFEKQLIRNLDNQSLQKKRYEELAPWETHFIDVEVGRHGLLINQTLNQLQLRQQFGINIAAIYRGTNVILSPRGNERIQSFDKLVILGNEEQIEQFTYKFIKKTSETEDTDILKIFSIKAILLEKNSVLIGKSIRDSKIREQTNGLVVGIERRGARFLNPDSSTVLEIGDVLFIVGEDRILKNI